jgi:sn-glycerol 3-phosphate transport system substrate-binding protein
MRKSLLALVAVLLLSVTLGACGGGEKGTPTPETPGAEPAGGTVSIDLWHSESAANADTLQRLISRYNSSQDEVKVQAFFQGTDQEIIAKLVTSLGSGKVPAVAVVGEVDTQKMLDSGTAAPVQDFIDREGYDLSDLDEKSIQMYTVQGKLWAMPFGAGMPLLYYNKVTFREVGLDPERPPRDLEEVRQYSEKFLKRDASGNVVRSGIALDIRAWMESILAEHDDLFVDSENGHEGRATKVLFDNDTGRWFFQWWHDMVDEGLAFNVGRNPTYADTLMALASGRAAMTFSYSSALRSVMDVLEKGVEGVEIGVAAVPGVPGGTGTPLLGHRVLWTINLRPEREQEAAWKFIKWLMEPEQQAEWFAGSGYLPVTHSAIDQPAAKDVVAKYPQFQVPLDLYLESPTTPAALGAVLGPFYQVREALYEGIEAMLSGAKDPGQALEDAAARANQIIEEYNRRVGGGD